jgi:WD40 repeat protein
MLRRKNHSRLSRYRQGGFALAMVMLTTTLVPAQTQASNPRGVSKPELILQSAHSGVVTSVAFSPDGKLLVSVGSEGTLKLWDLSEGYELQTIDVAEFLAGGHPPSLSELRSHIGVWSVTFMPDGKGIVAAIGNGVMLWKFGGGNLYFRQTDSVQGLSCDPHGRWIAVGSAKGAVTILDPNDLRVVRTIDAPPVLAIAISPDGSQLVSGGVDKALTLWDVSRGMRLRAFQGHTDYVRAVVFSADGQSIASGSDDKSIRIWSAATGALQKTLVSDGAVQALALSPDGRLIASANERWEVKLWDTVSGLAVKTWNLAAANNNISVDHSAALDFLRKDMHIVWWSSGGLAFSPDGHSLALGAVGTVLLWDLDSMKFLSTLGSRADLFRASFSPRGQYLAVTSSRSMALWDLGLGRPRSYLGGFGSAQFSPDGSTLAAGSNSQTIRIWDLETEQVIRRMQASAGFQPLGFSHDGALLASTSLDGTVKIWDVASGTELRNLSQPLNAGEPELVFHPSLPWLAIASTRGDSISIWDAATGQKIRDIDCQPPEKLVTILRQSPGASGPCGVRGLAVDNSSGSLAATGNFGARLWTGPDWTGVRDKSEEDAWIGGTALSSGGRFWVRASSVWDLSQNREAFNLSTHPDSPSFSPDSKWLASVGKGEAALWDMEKRDIAAFLASPGANDWLVVTPDGLFDGSPGAWSAIAWRFGSHLGDVVPVEAFFADFYYPQLLSDIVSGKHPKAARELAEVDRRQPVVKLTVSDPATDGPVSSRIITLHVKVESAPPDATHPLPSGVRDVRLFRNGALVKIWHGEAESETPYKIQVPIVAGTNRFIANAYNDANVKSRDARLVVTGAKSLARKGTAYIIAIGVNKYANHNYDLRYATQDAQAFSGELKEKQGQLDTFSHVEVISLFDKDATKDNILGALHLLAGQSSNAIHAGAPEELRRLETAQPEDAVFVYFAGHGTSAKSHFYLIPHDLGYAGQRDELDQDRLNMILQHSISDEDLTQSFEGIDAGKLVLIIDACNSGQAPESEEKRRGPMNSKGLAQLAYEKGMYVLTASQSYQAALEVDQLGHGLLTFALVEEGLKTPAAGVSLSTGDLGVREWLAYAAQRVPKLQQTWLSQSRRLEHGIEQASLDFLSSTTQEPRVFYREDSPRVVIAKIATKP